MPDYVLSASITAEDNASAASVAVAEAFNKAADAADALEASTTRASKSGTAWANTADPVTAAARGVATAMKNADAAQSAMSDSLAAGKITSDQFSNAMDNLNAKVDAARAKLAAAKAATTDFTNGNVGATTSVNAAAQAQAAAAGSAGVMASGMNTAAAAATGHSLATAGVTRELLVLGHEALTGNYTRMGGSFLVLAERTNALHTAIGLITPVLSTAGFQFGALATAGVAALTYLAVETESNLTRLASLSAQLRVTKTDYEALTAASTAVVKSAVAGSFGTVGKADAQTAYQTLAAVPDYHGTADDLRALILLSADVAKAFNEDIPKAAAQLAAALQNPAAAAKKLADEGFAGLDEAGARLIARMQAQGNITGAQAAIMDAYRNTLAGTARDGLTPLQVALQRLGEQFTTTGANGKSFAQELGEFGLDQAVKLLNDVKLLISEIQAIRDAFTHATGGPVVDAGTGQTVNASPNLNTAAANQIYRIAEANNIPAQIADLGTRIAYQESHGYQTKADGSPLISSAGAIGMFQLMPATAAGLGVDPNDADQNVLGGLKYLMQLSQNPNLHGEAAIAGAYNMGPGGFTAYQNGQRTLPAETLKYVQAVTGVSLPPGSGAAAGGPASSAPITVSAGLPDSVKAILKDPAGTVAETQENADDRISRMVRGLGDLDAAGIKSGPIVDDLQARLAKARGEYANTGTAIDLATRALNDGLAPLGAAAGAARTLAMAQNDVTLAARAQGQDATAEQYAERLAAVQAKLTAEFNDSVAALDQQTAATQRVNAAYSSHAASVIDAQNQAKAETEALKTSVAGTSDYANQVDVLTAALGRKSAADAEASTLAKGYDQKNELDQLALETQMLGQDTDAQNKALAVLKERQALIKAGGSGAPDTASGQADLANVAAIQDATAALSQQRTILSDLENVGTQAFDRIGSAITQAFTTGGLKAIDFGNIAKGVLSEVVQYVLKIAVLNPILNTLFGGADRPTLSSVGGVLGTLFGGGASVVAGAATAGNAVANLTADTAAANGTVFDGPGTAATTAAASSGTSILGTVGTLGTLAKSFGLFGGAGNFATGVTGVLGNAGEATNIALNGAGEGVYGVATSAEVGGASIANAAGLSDTAASTIASASSTVAEALPYIGAAVSVISSIAQGNYVSAGFTTAGAVIGSVIPGVGTALGAVVGNVVGSLVGSLFGGHKKNPYQDTEVDAVDGQLVVGKQVSQLQSTDGATAQVDTFAAQLNTFLTGVGVKLASNGDVGHIGDNITGLKQVDNVAALFPNLRFDSADPNDTSNFGITKQSLSGMVFPDIVALATQVEKLAGFADAMTVVGIQLAHVGTDLTNIQVASVSGAGGDSQLRTALNNDLPGQTFANVDALDAEIAKVNTFVNSTLPGLLDPVLQSAQSASRTAEASTATTYKQAITQAQGYGLPTDDLNTAMWKAIDMIRAPGIAAIGAAETAVQLRGATAGGGAYGAAATSLGNFDAGMQGQRDQLKKLWTDTYGDEVTTQADYLRAVNDLESTMGAERVALATQTQQQLAAVELGVTSTLQGVRARQAALSGDNQGADLIKYDVQAAQEQASFSKTFTDAYGDAFAQTTAYQNAMTELERVQQGERLAIVQKYTDQATTAIKGVVVNLDTYAHGLGTSALSPLSPQAQLDLARQQFQAVSGAATAGDYNSLQKLQGYTDTFLQASRAVNGSGAGYVADYQSALSALDTVSNTNQDMLTASYFASIAQSQTDQLVAELQALRAEVAALRLETGMSNATPARLAA